MGIYQAWLRAHHFAAGTVANCSTSCTSSTREGGSRLSVAAGSPSEDAGGSDQLAATAQSGAARKSAASGGALLRLTRKQRTPKSPSSIHAGAR